MTNPSLPHAQHGDLIEVPLSKLKASPRNARKTRHATADIEALAASIAAKGVIQPPVVEPEIDSEGKATGFYLVTIGEGRRQALLLRAKRKEIGKAQSVRCLVDTANDAHEISLDENVTRFAMHPADQFDAFRRLADERGFGAEEIAARFGVTPLVVRQRLRLASVSPKLIALYRGGDLSLDQVMAFTLSNDHERQEAVWASLSWNKEPSLIRRLLAEDRVSARDRRALYIGAEAFAAAGGVIERDLFADDHGGYFADPGLLDRMVMQQLEALAEAQLKEGWKWATATLDYPQTQGHRRLYPRAAELTPEEEAEAARLAAEYDAAVETLGDDEAPEIVAQIETLDAELRALAERPRTFAAEDKDRAGVFVTLGPDGQPRIEAGFVRPDDEPPSEAQAPDVETSETREGGALNDRLVCDLSAQRTAALRAALGAADDIALTAVVHALALQCFDFDNGFGTCLDLRLVSLRLEAFASGLPDSAAGKQLDARRAMWAERLPKTSADLWRHLLTLPVETRLSLLAHCVAESVNAVQIQGGGTRALAHADAVAEALSLDMADYWTATVDSYLGRVTKAQILEAVAEGTSAEAAGGISGLKKADMAEAAARLLEERRWLPALLHRLTSPDVDASEAA